MEDPLILRFTYDEDVHLLHSTISLIDSPSL